MVGAAAPPAVGASPTPTPTTTTSTAPTTAVAAAVPGADLSANLPRTMRDEVTGDFLGLGYQQRMRAENDKLNIYAPPARGGALLRSTPMDLSVAPPSVDDGALFPVQPTQWRLWDAYTRAFGVCPDCFQQRAEQYHVDTLYLAVLGEHLVLSGTKGNRLLRGREHGEGGDYPDRYRNLLYVLPLDGSCASETCARKVVDLPNSLGNPNQGDEAKLVAVTSLAAGTAGGRWYLAVGLSQDGVHIYDANLNPTAAFADIATPQPSQTPPVALAWDPAGSGLLAIGVMTYWHVGYFVDVKADGTLGQTNVWTFAAGDNLDFFPLSVAIGRESDGSPVAAFGMNDGTLNMVDPRITSGGELATFRGNANAIVAITPLPRIDGSSGGDDYAVVIHQRDGNPTFGYGAALRFDQAKASLSYLRLRPAAGSDTGDFLPNLDTFRSWYPGYRSGRFAITNTSADTVSVQLAAREQPGLGCWFAPGWADASAFPEQPVTIEPGATSATYSMGAATAGSDGACGADDATAGWRGYLLVTPSSRPGDARLVNLTLNENHTVDVSDQAGGGMTVSAALTGHSPPTAFGTWTITVAGPPPPAATSAPQIRAARITSQGTGKGSTVYRIDVGSTQWSVPGAVAPHPQVQATLPPLSVAGSVDGTQYVTLGSFLPLGTLNRSGSTLTVGGGTFFWENPTGQPAYRYLRVTAGADQVSNVVDLNTADPPTLNTRITSIQVTATKTAVNTATPAPNGLDQAQLLITIAAGTTLPGSDPAYQTVYYRDEGDNLITNLYRPGQYDDFVGVQPVAGAYPNSGTTAASTRRFRAQAQLAYDYVTTNSASKRQVQAYVGVSNARPANVTVQGTELDIQAASATGAASGFSLEGCTDFQGSRSCPIAPVTAARPAVYQAGSADTGPLVGALFLAQASNAVSDLPLTWKPADHQYLASSAVSLPTGTLAKLAGVDRYPSGGRVDTTLVTHGESVPATVPIGN
jgi:hypothetical protein